MLSRQARGFRHRSNSRGQQQLNIGEVSVLLGKASLVDSRVVDEATVQAWWEILSHLDFRDAMNGLIQHRRESTEYLMPAHIVKQARKAKRERERQEKRSEHIAIATPTRSAPPANFREMIAEASPAFRVHPETSEIDIRRVQAQLELKRLSGELGKMP